MMPEREKSSQFDTTFAYAINVLEIVRPLRLNSLELTQAREDWVLGSAQLTAKDIPIPQKLIEVDNHIGFENRTVTRPEIWSN